MMLPNKKVTEWEITKMEVSGNKMEFFIELTKYYTRQRREEGNRC